MRALIVDDEPLARRGVALRLEKCSDVEIVGEVRGKTGDEKQLDTFWRSGLRGAELIEAGAELRDDLGFGRPGRPIGRPVLSQRFDR